MFNEQRVMEMMAADLQMLHNKQKQYGDSWRIRGGVGAFFAMVRKWDRIEKQCETHKWDIFRAALSDIEEPDSFLDDVRDLRCFLLLVEDHALGLQPSKAIDHGKPVGAKPLDNDETSAEFRSRGSNAAALDSLPKNVFLD